MNLRLCCAMKACRASAEAAVAPGGAATTTAATTATTATAATATATTAATTTATPGHLLRTGFAALFLVEQVEGRQRRISDFFFAKQNALGR